MAQRKQPEADPAASEGNTPPTRVPVAIWVKDELVCVEIVDPPPMPGHTGVCRCPACHCAGYPDLAAEFFP